MGRPAESRRQEAIGAHANVWRSVSGCVCADGMCAYACVCADGMRAVQVAVVLEKLLVYAEVLRAVEPAGKLETSGRGRGLRSSSGGTLYYTPNIQMFTPNYVMYTPNSAVLCRCPQSGR